MWDSGLGCEWGFEWLASVPSSWWQISSSLPGPSLVLLLTACLSSAKET